MKNKFSQFFSVMGKQRQEPFWQDQVNCFFDFYREKFDNIPSFDGSAPRDLKCILRELRKRAEYRNVTWDHENAISRFRKFLEMSYQDPWLRERFMLFQINRNKDKIFNTLVKTFSDQPKYQDQVNDALRNYKPISE